MKPREFVVRSNAELRNCVYTVIPVIDRRLLDLPYHIHRLKQSFSLLLDSDDSLHTLSLEKIFSVDNARYSADDLITRSCLRSSKSTSAKDGLLTICIGLKDTQSDSDSPDKTSLEVNSFLYEMPNTFLSISPENLTVDLQEYRRVTDPRIKDAGWPKERSKLENSRYHGASETIIFIPRESSRAKCQTNDRDARNDNDQDVNNESNRDNDDIVNGDSKFRLTEGKFLIKKSLTSYKEQIVINESLKYFISYYIRFRFDIKLLCLRR